MGRTAKKVDVQDVAEKTFDTEGYKTAVAVVEQANQAVALVNAQRDSAVRAVAEQLGYQLPADAVDADLIQRDIAANMRRSVEACLEVGRGLRVLKAACEHGQFAKRLELLSIEARVAQKFMATAARFSNASSTPLLKAAGNQTKLFEMLVLDDEQIEELELTGQTGELSLDDVATMSVKELRAALRESRAEHDATKAVATKKQARIDQLERAQERIAKLPPDAELEKLQQEATTHLLTAQGAIRGNLRAALIALKNHQDDNSAFMAGMVNQLISDLQILRDEFDLPKAAGDGRPEWETWNDKQPVAANA